MTATLNMDDVVVVKMHECVDLTVLPLNRAAYNSATNEFLLVCYSNPESFKAIQLAVNIMDMPCFGVEFGSVLRVVTSSNLNPLGLGNLVLETVWGSLKRMPSTLAGVGTIGGQVAHEMASRYEARAAS